VGSATGPSRRSVGRHHYSVERRTPRPILVTNPVDDGEFAFAGERLLDDGFLLIDEFRIQLRIRYPDAAVHRREVTAEPHVVWYVYRDGRWVSARQTVGESRASPADGQPHDLRATERALHRDPGALATLQAQKAALDPTDAEARRTSDKVQEAARSLSDKAAADEELGEEIEGP